MAAKQKECPSCAMNIDTNEEVCPICGYEFPRQSSMLKFAVVIMIILFVLLIVWGIF